MSETITKACDNPVCINGHMYWENNDGVTTVQGPCKVCSGTGRVPDIEAMLRAQIDAARAEVTRLTAEVERLKAMTIEAVKGTSLTIIDAIGGTAQQTIEGLRADPEFAEVALRAQLGCAPCSARAQGPLSVVREDPCKSVTP